jgi:hypothetical protein
MCAREISLLKSHRNSARVEFRDVMAPDFDPAAWARSQDVPPTPLPILLREMHVFDVEARRMHTRVPAFRALYYKIFERDILAFTAHPPWASLADTAYGFIAAHKHRLAFVFAR